MNNGYEYVQMQGQQAPYMQSCAFNSFWQYGFGGNSSFYAMLNPAYHAFMTRRVRNWLWWYDGYVPYFHNEENGIVSTRLATAICDRTAKQVVGGRIRYKIGGRDVSGASKLNEALAFISDKWADKTDFARTVKQAVRYAAAGGTSLVKLNKAADGELWSEALRIDNFIPEVDYRGRVVDVLCFIRTYTRLLDDSKGRCENYYLVEHRYFDDYKRADGSIVNGAPIVEYCVHRQNGDVVNGEFAGMDRGERIRYETLPKAMRGALRADFGLLIDSPILLPFVDDLGCELVKWTDGISDLPQLPFGESLLANLTSTLMQYDYYSSAMQTDMYTGRARVMLPSFMQNVNGGGQNSGLDNFLYTKLPYVDNEKQQPIPLQFDLRSTSWTEIRDHLLQNIAILTGMNISTLASFLQDTTAARTAREISTEENETAGFVYDKREIIERPLNRLLKTVGLYYGYSEDVVLRWAVSSLTNKYSQAEIITMALSGGFMSERRAVEQFNPDDDDVRIQAEYDQITEDKRGGNGQDYFGDADYIEDANEDIGADNVAFETRGEKTD